jgi:outer membrane protein TolC
MNAYWEKFIVYFPYRRLRCVRTQLVSCAGLVLALCSCCYGQTVDAAVKEQPSVITLKDALRLARAYSPQLQTAETNAHIAHENRLQARDARLPTVNALNQFVYTEGNGTPSGVFIANDGVHVYNEQAVVRENLFSLVRNGQSRQAQAAEAVAKAQEEIARRGLVAIVVQDYYNLLTAERKVDNANQSLQQASQFVDITSKQEQAGIVSHVDVVKAEMQAEQRSQDLQNQTLAVEQARLSLAVLLFSRFDQAFTVVDDLASLPVLPTPAEAKATALEANPDLQSARSGVAEAEAAATVARYAYLPTLSVNFNYGIDANQLASSGTNTLGTSQSQLPNILVHKRQNLGYAGDITLDIPVWNWGATRSKVRQAEASVHLAQMKAGFAEREIQASLRSLYQQAETTRNLVTSLGHARDLAEENLHLTLLRYEAGEATALEAVSAEDSLALAKNAFEDGLNRYHMALAQLQTLTGNL